MRFDFQKSRQYLQEFEFGKLFREVLGWGNPPSRKVEGLEINGTRFDRVMVAELSGVVVYEIRGAQVPSQTLRQQVYRELAKESLENLLIFVDEARTQSSWYWVKREDKRQIPRNLSYYKGQSGDLILGKISALLVDFAELENGDLSVVQVAEKLRAALDVEQVTRKFYDEFKVHLEWFVLQIQGIEKESDRRWYASIILNRLMFVYFLQYKGFVDGNQTYLQDKLAQFENSDFYHEFLCVLFFEGFAKAAPNRSNEVNQLLGSIKYLNGGLFTEHRIEKDNSIAISNEAFERTFNLFQGYTWNLDDTPGGNDDEINPSVLGYIFEKYINQKEFGAYYTRPEITEYLCDRTIKRVILDKTNAELTQPFETFDDLERLLTDELCLRLVNEILPQLSLLDPACGSGAFLVAAMKTLIAVYQRIVGIAELSKNRTLRGWLKKIQSEHQSTLYFIKKRIITDNLYGVDIMEEATEIAKLRLFLALVGSAQSLAELEPLPNVDFNIMAGNSLIGLIRVDEDGFNGLDGTAIASTQKNSSKPKVVQGSFLPAIAANEYRQILEEKNESIALFKQQAFRADGSTEPEIRTDMLKASIDELNGKSQTKLNRLLFDEFGRLQIRFEQAQAIGRPKKRLIEMKDIAQLKPFHWGYHFDQVVEQGGFDAIIANPPWEVLQTNEKEFFQQYAPSIHKKKLRIEEWERQRNELLTDPEIKDDWLRYESTFPHQWAYFKKSAYYKNQTTIVNGKAVGNKPNFYSLFVEQCFNLLKTGGVCGFVISSGIYSDLGTKQLREMLFNETTIDSFLSFENQKGIFESVDSRYKFAIITFKKAGKTKEFPARFMCQDVKDLETFPGESSIVLQVDLVRKLSPGSLSIREFRSTDELKLALKLFDHPFINDSSNGWGLELYGEELNMSRSSIYFQTVPTDYPVYEGSMIWHFCHTYSEARYWVEEFALKGIFAKKRVKRVKDLATVPKDLRNDYEAYRIAIRKIARNNDTRTLISTIIPPGVFVGNSLSVNFPFYHSVDAYNELRLTGTELLCLTSLINSFVVDHVLRSRINTNLNIFHLNELSIPRLHEGDRFFAEIVERAAKLICTTPEFDDLAAEVGLGVHTNGITEEAARAQLRAELDGMIAHLYNLTEAEFAHILATFPLVSQETKDAASEAYRQFAPPTGDIEIANLIKQGESGTLEFKSTARWSVVEAKQDPKMEEIIVKTSAAFLNSQGGTLLIGVDDSGQTLGLANDYRTFKSGKQNRDSFEAWLMGDLLLQAVRKDLASAITISFHILNGREICKVTLKPSPRPVFVTVKNKNDQPKKTFFIRTGNSTRSLDDPDEMLNYIRDRWPK